MFGSCSDFSGALYKADLERKLHRAVTCQGWGRGFKSLRPLQCFQCFRRYSPCCPKRACSLRFYQRSNWNARLSAQLWGWTLQFPTPQKSHLPRKSCRRRIPFASLPIGTVYFDGKPNRPSSLIRCHGRFWAENGRFAFVILAEHCRRAFQ